MLNSGYPAACCVVVHCVIENIMIEKIPFLHRQKMYNIIVEDDIALVALHHILDVLLENDAFIPYDGGDAELYTITYEEICYTVGVDGSDVMIVIK